ncbi:MAG: hypothetical protein ACSHWW_00825 [Nonlabens sp.]|uniref:hypothetical protein n=1 Tax=Nonlabens sp. TaxID=1888209 RepID=UPI003EF8B0EA
MKLEIVFEGFKVSILEDNKNLFNLKIKDKSFLWSSRICAYEDKHLYGEISSSSFSFKSKLKIGLQDYQIRYEASGFAGSYLLSGNSGHYEIIPHKGNKVSIFKNNIQIGYYEKDLINVLKDQKIVLFCDKYVKFKLIIMIILSVEFSGSSDRSTVNIDFGNIGGELRPFDESWYPKDDYDR